MSVGISLPSILCTKNHSKMRTLQHYAQVQVSSKLVTLVTLLSGTDYFRYYQSL